ncbi:MAG: thiamine pyrophosphate-dependent enzyme [Dehalococcoidia bacterium]
MTYRYRGHSMADPELYRLKDEVEDARRRDCIARLRTHMQELGLIDDDSFAALQQRVDEEMDEVVAFADASPEPGLDTLFDHVVKESVRA